MFLKRISMALISLILTVMVTSNAFAAPVEYSQKWTGSETTTSTISFTDVPATHWAYKYIAEMVNRKVISGYPDNKFRPNNTITRAEFAKIMVTASGITPTKVNYSSFSDIPVSNWASPFVEAVKDYMTGYRTADGKYIFNISAPATREDVAIALVKLKGYDANRLPDQSTIEAMFKDYAGISESAKSYVALAVENGLVSGFDDETFRPQATVTRAEATVMLWRAYQYGNDNKSLGGEEPATTPSPTTSTPTPKPTALPTSASSSKSSTQSSKFSVDTLVGGTGQGVTDGPASSAQINQVDSLAINKNDDIFLLDSSSKKVRKFSTSSGTLEPYKTVDSSFDWMYSSDGINKKRFGNETYKPRLLTYNQANDHLYVLGSNGDNDAHELIYDITGDVQIALYNLDSYMWGYNKQISNFKFVDDHSAIYSETVFGNPTETYFYKGEIGSAAKKITSSVDGTGVRFWNSYSKFSKTETIVSSNDFFTLDSENRTLSRIQLFPRKVNSVAAFDNLKFDSLSTYNGSFYITSSSSIYKLTTDGKLSTFIDGDDLTYNDGNPIQAITHLVFDSRGNVILYDDSSKSIRRINL